MLSYRVSGEVARPSGTKPQSPYDDPVANRAAGAVPRGDRAKCEKHESVVLNLSGQWGRVRKTLV